MKTIKKFCALVVCALASLPSMAQQTYQEMEQLTINENVTTVITASELRMQWSATSQSTRPSV